ncbi:permease prefix domain 1-containing protein [Marinilactibacillus sp. Marseille-P9653]|uniref:permease prefix domain 1-containing protein n=1 Tax=Marinilactibacillus sp. Marseille-P9653 TaxID=2866583 RepID=UPI001CE40FFE|nr:permease prefix domain 1-containing protein [Marinilactibacillus sp. Marseille-P9653]
MNTIEEHIELLFKPYKKNKLMRELKEEVYSNLLARKEDLLLEGYSEEAAVRNTIAHIDSVDHLIEENKKVDWNSFLANLLQSMTLYSVIIWILTLPLSLFPDHLLLNYLFMMLSFISGIIYIVYLRKAKNGDGKIKFMNIKRTEKLKIITWQLWFGFIVISLLSVTGIYFASHLWFSRPISISGPYQFGEVALRYLTPFSTVIIPLTIHKAANLIAESEVEVIE